MSRTRFMTVMFSATENGDEELTQQVADDIQSAKENGSFEDDEMSYNDLKDGRVLAMDKGTGEYTMIHTETGDSDYIDLEEVPEFCVEGYLHPEVIEEQGSAVVNPMLEGKDFSVTTDNQAVLRIFSDQDLVETVTESVYKSEQDAQIGDLKFEKDSDTDGVIVTDLSSGDKAKVELDGPDMKVTELDQKNFKSFSNTSNKDMNVIRRKVFSNAEQYEPIFVVGIDPINKVLVNSPVYGEVAANELAGKLNELGLVGINVFADPDQGREYALQLLESDGCVGVADEEEMQVAYSDQTVIANRYFSDRTRFMNRLFSEAEENVTDHQDLVESAIADGDQLETEDFIITPISDEAAVVEDKENGEYTVAELDDEDINVESINESQANKLMDGLDVESEEEGEKEFSVTQVRNYSILSKLSKKIAEKGAAMKQKAVELAPKPGLVRIDQAGAGTRITEDLAKKANKLGRRGEFLEKNADALAGATLATAGVATAGAGLGAAKLMKKQKDNSDTLAQIEDSSIEAIQNVQEAAETAIQGIEQAKAAPVEQNGNVVEATYSAKLFSDGENKSLADVWK